MSKTERLSVAVPGGELQQSVMGALAQSGLQFTAEPRRLLHSS